MAASYSPKDCPICQDEYNEDERCPRSLPCSHTFCSECIANLIIRNSKICPFCQREFTATAARDIGINTSLLDVLKLLKETEQRAPAPRIDPSTSRSIRKNDLKRETEEILNKLLGVCQEEEEEIDRCLGSTRELENTFVQANETIKSNILPHIKEMLTTNEDSVKYLKECSSRLHRQKRNINEKRRIVQEAKTKLSTSNTFMQIVAAADETENLEVEVHQHHHELKSQVSEEEKTCHSLDEVAKITKDQVQTLSEAVRPKGKKNKMDFIPDLRNMKILSEQITPMMLQNMNTTMKTRIREEGVYAVQHHEGKKRFGKISMSDENKIMLHCLKEGALPPNVYTIEHQEVMSLVDPSAKMVFLDFGTDSSTLGRIFINLTPGSKRAQNFFLLCTGEVGQTYFNTVIYGVCYKGQAGEYIVSGDYETNTGKGGKAVVPGAGGERGGMYQQPHLAGSVFGWFFVTGDPWASQFGIATKDDVSDEVAAKFGEVESGLEILSKAVSDHPNIRDVRIIDCGVVVTK